MIGSMFLLVCTLFGHTRSTSNFQIGQPSYFTLWMMNSFVTKKIRGVVANSMFLSSVILVVLALGLVSELQRVLFIHLSYEC